LSAVWKIQRDPRPRPAHAAQLLRLAKSNPMCTSTAFYAAEGIRDLLRDYPHDAKVRAAIQSAALEYYYDGAFARYQAVLAMRDALKSTGEVAFVDTLQRLANMGQSQYLGPHFASEAALVLRDLRARHPDHPALRAPDVETAIRRLDTDDFYDLRTLLKNIPRRKCTCRPKCRPESL
jgi:hypothetical protein